MELEWVEGRWCQGASGIQKENCVRARDEREDAAILERWVKKVGGGKRTGAEPDPAVGMADWQFQDIASIRVWEG